MQTIEKAPTETSSLELIPTITAIELFESGNVRTILEKIKEEARSIVTDPTTDKGRKEIASLAHKVAKTKVAMDEMGKSLTDEQRKFIDRINEERRTIRDELDALKEEVRKPLTDYENREKDRVAAHESRIARLVEKTSNLEGEEIATLEALASKVEEFDPSDMEEFRPRAEKEKEAALYRVRKILAGKKAAKEAAEKAEAERIERERIEREEREARIAAEAAERARIEAEEKAREEARKAEEAREAERKAEADRLAKIEREKAEAEQRAKEAAERAERERIEAEERHKREVVEAEERARREAEEKERQRLAAIEAERAAEDKRAANKRHREKILAEAAEDLSNLLVSGDVGRAIADAIASSKIRHASIQF